ncbi:MAG: SRPBCC domain-containing protein [Marmoricola sp.]
MTRTDTASRLIRADAQRVFAALLDAAALTEWLIPNGMTGHFEEFDARPGGSYRLVLTYEEGSAGMGKATPESDIVEVRFLDIVPNVRVAQAVDFVSEDPAFAGTMEMTWELDPQDDRTHVTIRAENVPRGIGAKEHRVGLNASLAQLASFLDRE